MTPVPSATGLTAQWAQYASQIRYEHLPHDAVEALKALILDTIGTTLAGSALGDGAAAVTRFVNAVGGAPEATLIGHGKKVSLLGAAFGNGAFAHALNYDASGSLGGHIGVAAVPTPLAFVERAGHVSGRELLAATAVAVDFTARLAASLELSGVDANERFLEGQLLGYFGATVGAGRIMRFTAEQMHDAIGIALMQAAGTRQISFEGRGAKAIYGAYPNHGAAMSVLLAEQGLDARCAALEGPAGAFALFFNNTYDLGAISEGLGSDFRYLDIRFKQWPTSNRLHPFIRAAARLRQEHAVDPADIAAIHLRVGPMNLAWLEPSEERRHPQNAATAANSIYFGVAKALVNGTVALEDVSAAGLRQPEADGVADLISYTIDEGLSHTMAGVEVRLKSGAVLDARDEGRHEPMSYSDLVTKFEDCARHAAVAVPKAALNALIDAVSNLEDVANVGAVLCGLNAAILEDLASS